MRGDMEETEESEEVMESIDAIGASANADILGAVGAGGLCSMPAEGTLMVADPGEAGSQATLLRKEGGEEE